MKKVLPACLFLFALLQQLSAQYTASWKRSLGNEGFATTIKPTPDNGFVSTFNSIYPLNAGICAQCDFSTLVHESISVVKMDSTGKIEWSHCFTGKENNMVADLAVMPDGSIILAGASNSSDGFFADIPSKGAYNIFLAKLSPRGDIMWKKTINSPYFEVPARVIATEEGGFIVGAYSNYPTDNASNTLIVGDGDFYLLKFSANGTLQWNKRYGGSAQDYLKTLQQDAQGHYVAVGWTRSNNGMVSGNPTQGAKPWLIKVDGAGNLLTQKVFDLADSVTVNDLLIDPKGDYVLVGGRHQGIYTIYTDVWAMKVSGTSRQVVWNKTWSPSGTAYGSRVLYTKEGHYLLAAGCNGNPKNLITGYEPNRDWWLLEIDTATAGMLWNRSYGGHSSNNKVSMEAAGSTDRLILYGDADGNQFKTDFIQDLYLWASEKPGASPPFSTAGYMLLYRNGTMPPQVPPVVRDTIIINKFLCKPPYRHHNESFYYRDTSFIALVQNGQRYKVYEKLTITFGASLVTRAVDTTICHGGVVNNNRYYSDGLTQVMLKNRKGCDSLQIRYQVKVLPATMYAVKDTSVCRGTVFLDSVVINSSRVLHYKTLKNSLRCDSIHYSYSITVIDPYAVRSTKDMVLCYGSRYQGVPYYRDTAFTDTSWVRLNCGTVPELHKTKITVGPYPSVSLGRDTTFCKGTHVVLQAAGSPADVSYLWSTGNSSSYITLYTTGTFWVRATNQYGCTASDTVVVTYRPDSIPLAGNDTVICNGTSATLQASGGKWYAWSPGSYLSCIHCARPTARPVQTTTYKVAITGNCRTEERQVRVVVRRAAIDAGPHRNISAGDTVRLRAAAIADSGVSINYNWTPATALSCSNCPDPVASPGRSTLYRVEMATAEGCKAADTVGITVNHPRPALSGLISLSNSAYSAARPATPLLDHFRLEIFNSDGLSVFVTRDASKGWDGSVGAANGVKAKPGVYLYRMEYRSASGNRMRDTGRILLVP